MKITTCCFHIMCCCTWQDATLEFLMFYMVPPTIFNQESKLSTPLRNSTVSDAHSLDVLFNDWPEPFPTRFDLSMWRLQNFRAFINRNLGWLELEGFRYLIYGFRLGMGGFSHHFLLCRRLLRFYLNRSKAILPGFLPAWCGYWGCFF